MSAFNQYLKSLRERKLLDIGTVAKQIGVHRNTQANYEDRRDPPFDYLVDFANLVDVSLIDILMKRLQCSNANDAAILKAKDSLEALRSQCIEDSSAQYNVGNLSVIKLDEESHSQIPLNASVYIDINDREIITGNLYAFLNPMSGKHFAARLIRTDTQLKLVFDNAERKDLEFNLDGGTVELTYILKTLGLLGRILKAEVIF
ncbi:transcriptional regulator [Pseudoalteromonas shioyasakiensis]|nr:transcriptional regulator [Pseudoalteromonas shioyasakiensis]